MDDPKDQLIYWLAQRLYICSRLLTRAAERLGWDSTEVQQLVKELTETTERLTNASIQE